MSHYHAVIVVRSDGVDVVPDNRQVQPVAEDFKLGIEWPEKHSWDSVTVGDFVRVGNGTQVEIVAPLEFLPKDGDIVKAVRFKTFEARTDFSNYKVRCHEGKKKPLVEIFTVELLSIYGKSPAPAQHARGRKTK